MYALIGPLALFLGLAGVDDDVFNEPGLLFMIVLCNLLLAYLIYPHTKWGKKSTSKKDLKSKWEKFENSKEYEEILKNLS